MGRKGIFLRRQCPLSGYANTKSLIGTLIRIELLLFVALTFAIDIYTQAYVCVCMWKCIILNSSPCVGWITFAWL